MQIQENRFQCLEDVKCITWKDVFILSSIFVLIWYCNYCTPLLWDDYVYSYVWQNNAMTEPLTKTAVRINCFKDILFSQWSHYISWGGRTVPHVLIQFFLWQGKGFFNVINAGCFVILLLEIQWAINKGQIGFCYKNLLWIFCLLWFFSAYLNDIFTWVTLSCNYLWTTTLLLAFLLVYENVYFSPRRNDIFKKNKVLFFLFGLLAGWTNENTVCFVIAGIGFYLFASQEILVKPDSPMLIGLYGLLLGYLLLMLAPGNYVRYSKLLQNGLILTGIPLLKSNLNTFIQIVLLRFLLFYYVLKNVFHLKRNFTIFVSNNDKKKEIYVALFFLYLSIGSLIVMILSPEFRFRSSFPSLVFLIVAAGIIQKIKQSAISSRSYLKAVKKIVCYTLIAYTCLTVFSYTYLCSLQKQQTDLMIVQINTERIQPTGKVLVVQEIPDLVKDNLEYCFMITGGHVPYAYSLTTDENYWINKDVALYYGITSIKAEK